MGQNDLHVLDFGSDLDIEPDQRIYFHFHQRCEHALKLTL